MVSINTNLSSLIVQGNLANSTNGLNKAVERLSTGYKINHAGDNAANYSIANKYEAKLYSYDVAADNITMGMDLLSVAQDTISTMQNHGARLQALITQARNGTYGAQSLNAMTQEAGAIISEIQRMYTNTEYNGINLFDNSPLPDWAKEVKANAGITEGQTVGLTKDLTPKANGFIDDIVTVTPDIVVESADDLEDAISENSIIGIANADVLAELATIVNGGNDCSEKTFTLTKDIDLSDYQAGEGWTAIGTSSKAFNGTFDGQGHKITGLKINKSTDNQGLFGYSGHGSIIKNVGIIDCNVQGNNYTGALVGYSRNKIINCYSSGTVKGINAIGGITGYAGAPNVGGYITACYSECSVSGTLQIGGIAGYVYTFCSISDSFATGNITSTSQSTGGLAGDSRGSISNCYATGNVSGKTNYTGGLVGYATKTITNCYATGMVESTGNTTGGLVGYTDGTVSNSYATGSVNAKGCTGGLIGESHGNVTNSYAEGDVTGTSKTGGLVGYSCSTVSKTYATGNVKGNQNVGGLIGNAEKGVSYSYAIGNINANDYNIGGLVGYATSTASITGCYAVGNVIGKKATGGLAGQANNNVKNSFATGDVSGTNWVGGLVGQISKTSGTLDLDTLFSSGKVSGDEKLGSLIGGIANTDNGSSFGTINITNTKVVNQDMDVIGFEGKSNGTAYESGQMNDWLANIKEVKPAETNLQVGIMGNESSRISFDTGFEYDLSSILTDISSDKAYSTITKFMSTLSEKATDLGAASNRLESALDSVLVNMENLTSSLSTVKDVDMAQESSQYIRMQILQQASATLLATANQSPSIALQLI